MGGITNQKQWGLIPLNLWCSPCFHPSVFKSTHNPKLTTQKKGISCSLHIDKLWQSIGTTWSPANYLSPPCFFVPFHYETNMSSQGCTTNWAPCLTFLCFLNITASFLSFLLVFRATEKVNDPVYISMSWNQDKCTAFPITFINLPQLSVHIKQLNFLPLKLSYKNQLLIWKKKRFVLQVWYT